MVPHKRRPISSTLGRDIVLAICILAATAIVSVTIGFSLHESQLGAWGSWLGAFIAGIALLASGYAVVVQARQGESTSWNIALGRLGELYDTAFANPRLADIITQPSDLQGNQPLSVTELDITPQERVWLGSLFLAFEQIYVATMALSSESRRVWRLYLRNQLNKPIIRAVFVSDAADAKDFHAKFYEFVRGHKSHVSPSGYANGAIHPKFFEFVPEEKSPPEVMRPEISARAFDPSDASFWLTLYTDEEVRRQMYAAPTSNERELIDYLAARQVYTVTKDGAPIGGFTLTLGPDRLATFGIVLAKEWRGKNIAAQIMRLLELKAQELGVLTLRGDVYADNFPSIRALEKAGFRKFLWFEKNLEASRTMLQ